MKLFRFIVYTLLFISIARAKEVQIQFEQANQLYRNGDYKNAVTAYEKINKNGYCTPDLYFNLANAYFKLDNIANSILYYERAKKLSPNDEDINYNLKIANLKVVDKIEPIPRLFFIEWWNSISRIFSSNSWALITIIALWLGIICFSLFRISRSPNYRRTIFFCGVFILFISLLSTVFGVQQNQMEKSENMGIIFSSSVAVKSSPDQNGTDLFILHEGVKVEILDRVEKWRKIKLADGKIGWLPDETVETI
jgi:tetratricopeptide (TPR) repeat protein